MQAPRQKTTSYFNLDLHRALRIKAAETGKSLSNLENEMVQAILAEDAEDLAACAKRAGEPDLPFAEVLEDLRRQGRI